MNETNDRLSPTIFEPLRRYVPLAVWIVVVLTLLMIPLKIISYGYLPGDDALRHAAKAVSSKPWSEILVLNPVYKIDHEFGWSLLLEKVHVWTNWDAEKLVLFSVVGLFILVSWSVLPWLKRPEAWLITLILATVVTELPQRFMTGRPFLVTMAGTMSILLLWQAHGSAPPKKWMLFLMAGLVAAGTFFHGVWYLWGLVIAAFFFAGQFRWGFAFTMCWAAGVLAGSMLTGHPIEYPLQAFKIALLAVGAHATTRTMALELQPVSGDIFALIILGGLLVLRQLMKLNTTPFSKNPMFWLICLTWVLGSRVGRFWDDWGWPALAVLIICDLQLLLQVRFAADSFKRLGLACGLAIAFYFCLTCDTGSRWSSSLLNQYLTADNSDLKGWMPEKGGIFYTSDMTLFYQTFFKNPTGDWRYMLGFEPTLMPKEDFETYHKIIWNFGDDKGYAPWVKKMKSADRLAMRGGRNAWPNIPQLEWNYGVSGIWIGRTPRTSPIGTPPPTIPATAAR